jgi:AcrR family transcriptional regulator
VRTALIETAARIVATEGRAGLTLRRLAREVGTSTMAVYTHFGSMDELRREVRREGFARLRQHLGAVEATRDPMADLSVLGAAYYLSATSEPNLYRAMFLDGPINGADTDTGLDTFMYLVNGVARCLEVGLFPNAGGADPAEMAVEVWALSHGLVSLQLAHLLPEQEAVEHMQTAARTLFIGWGADRGMLRRSLDRAHRRLLSA